jgi:hypothetical protein
MSTSHYSIRKILASLTLLGLVAAMYGSQRADAAASCRADPVIVLSTVYTIDMHATFNNGVPTNIQHISYVLHGPPLTTGVSLPIGGLGVHLGIGFYTVTYPDFSGSYSSFSYVPDNTAGNYDAYITVTSPSVIPVTAYMDWVVGLGAPTPTAPAQGFSGQALRIHMHVS